MTPDDREQLLKQVEQLQHELAEARLKMSELEHKTSTSTSADVGDISVTISEFEDTLRRLVQRTAMIVQAEKCVVMVRDREAGCLVARTPAFGLSEEEVKAYRVIEGEGGSDTVYQSGEPLVFASAQAANELDRLKVRNGISVPLLVEKRDDNNMLMERITVGVLNCFNKRYGGEFNDEDIRLLERLSRSAAAVIANAQMFQEVVAEKEKLVQTLESLTAGLLLINQKNRVVQMNAHARQMFVEGGVDPLNRPFTDVIQHEECKSILQRMIQDSVNPLPTSLPPEENKKPDEIRVYDSDGREFIYQMHAATVRDDANNLLGTVIIFNDVTELRNLEQMKTNFVSIVAHELRTPLTPMKGFIRTLLDDVNEEWYLLEDRREFYTIIDENIDRLSRLINDLLNISRIERLGAQGLEMTWEQVELHEVADSVVTMQRGRTDRHTLVVDFSPEHIIIETDKDMIQNVLHNIISNSIKYAPGGGEIRILARIEPANAEHPESVVIGVKDQGMGMTEPFLKRIGEKFNRGDGRTKSGGTGIGLWLVKNIVLAHHGAMWAESPGIDQGTTFWVRLPVVHREDDNDAPVTMQKD
ncbi:MAG: ATP-binding protein [Armatimonadetes bacterium]|nr:ATP-binding protein [Armatimonadota bacterium]